MSCAYVVSCACDCILAHGCIVACACLLCSFPVEMAWDGDHVMVDPMMPGVVVLV